NTEFDWKRIAYTLLASRAIDEIEETRLMPERKVLYQFSARGHDLPQIILGSLLNHKHDGVSAYYRSRPLLLSLGLSLEDAFASPMAKSGGFSDGRDIGVVCNLPGNGSPTVLPMSGDVGSQFTPAAGWAQALVYRYHTLKEKEYFGALAVVHGGEAAVATNGFWSCLTMATTLKLPLLIYIEDNSFGISVPGSFQTPGGNIAQNLASFKNLFILEGDGTDPAQSSELINNAVCYMREGRGPALLRLTVPRLSGHSGQDTQTYKGEQLIADEKERDPLPKLESYLVPEKITVKEWKEIKARAERDVSAALEAALARPEPDPGKIKQHVFFEEDKIQSRGGLYAEKHSFPPSSSEPASEGPRINMVTAIRKTLEAELVANPKLLVFGEDVGPKGGVHAATLGLQDAFGADRVFDTSLSEEGIIGRSVGMALCGLMPVPEIQFRKYADPATEQLNNCGTIRWRTNNRFAAPIVVRMPGGFFKCGDPWHSVCDEVRFAHAIGWQVCFPSNAEDAVGLLRAALRSNNPTIFFEHRHLYDSVWARRPYPGDKFLLPLGEAKIIQPGSELTIVSWGAMLEICEEAAKASGASVEIVDLRTISPWDRGCVKNSVAKTRRCLIVHEDGITAGFGAEIAAYLAKEAFFSLDAPIVRVACDDIPIPYNVNLMQAVLPSLERVSEEIRAILEI
ncbi:MAG: pyruvate dehydrogenase, partial [Proteobacteria bacterium]